MQLELQGIASDPNDLGLINIETFNEFDDSRDALALNLLDAMCNSKYKNLQEDYIYCNLPSHKFHQETILVIF